MTNFGSSDLDIKVGDRIAQIMFLKTEESLFEEVSELGSTAGGAGGFGSTNYKLFLESSPPPVLPGTGMETLPMKSLKIIYSLAKIKVDLNWFILF